MIFITVPRVRSADRRLAIAAVLAINDSKEKWLRRD
jgi:hypothetical protein